MKPFLAASYDPREWWYGHLCRALASEADIRAFPAPEGSEPGFSWETPVTELIRGKLTSCEAFLSSVSMLHSDLPTLPCLTATWADYLPDPGAHAEILNLFDILFVTCHEGIELWKSRGVEDVHWLPFAFDDCLEIERPATRETELAFVGALNLPIHNRRREYLDALAGRFRMNDFHRRYSQREAAGVYAGARMVVNITELRGFNMRNFEAMGEGALLLTQKTGYGIPEMFQDGVHLVVFNDLDDLIEKAGYYLRHEEERALIAGQGRAEVLAKHTYRHRAREFLRVIASSASRRGLGRRRADRARAYANFYRQHRRLDKLVALLCERGMNLRQRAWILRQSAACVAKLCRRGNTPTVPQ